MIPQNKQTISPTQFLFFIIQTQIGISYISLPFHVHQSGAKSDGWLSVLLTGIAIQFVLFLYWFLSKRFPTLSFYDILPAVFGKLIGKLLSFAFILYFLLVGSIIYMQYNYIIEIWAFPRTPLWVFALLLSILALYIVRERLRVIGRFQTIVSFLLFILIFISLPGYENTDIRFVLPIGENGLGNIIAGVKDGMLSFWGFECILFLYPFVEGSRRQKILAATSSNIFVTLYYTYFTFLTFIFFSPEEIPLVPQPLLYILKAFTFPVFERIDILFLSTWIVFVSSSLVSYMYLCSIGVASVLSLKHHKKAVPYVVGCSAVLSLLPLNSLSIENYTKVIDQTAFVFAIIIPIVTLLATLVFKKQKVSV
ncbi:GerAB/ArcD/ProY family transporter [Evansella cellulosilytica]|uniref:Spore germination protein n=1 Tax=Evansella cellulosilytica (strain ATCC 21833 / DSM 2522 / FERM P-1141 / JCM 9156 / N-4) TaxID=649639 RepID=E6TQG7_EVAC2|nr:GerAB/ArcD/ProY family transporter [Evansella cellulosilytica]ADU29345.1 spore germination protein [Evansella cellulosilytica DSM 2522]